MTVTADSVPPRWSAGKRRRAERSLLPPHRAAPESRSDFQRVFPWVLCSAWNVQARSYRVLARCFASCNSVAPSAQGISWRSTGDARLSVFWRTWVTVGSQGTDDSFSENAPRSAGSPPPGRLIGALRRPFRTVMRPCSRGGVLMACRSASENILHKTVKSSCRYA